MIFARAGLVFDKQRIHLQLRKNERSKRGKRKEMYTLTRESLPRRIFLIRDEELQQQLESKGEGSGTTWEWYLVFSKKIEKSQLMFFSFCGIEATKSN